MVETLKALAEQFDHYVECHTRLLEKGTPDCLALIPETKVLIADVQDRYSQARTDALAAVKRGANYQPGTIVVLMGESFAENEHGEFVRIK